MTEKVTYKKINLLGNLNNIFFETSISMLLVSENNMFLLQTHKLEISKTHHDHFSNVTKKSNETNFKLFTASANLMLKINKGNTGTMCEICP